MNESYQSVQVKNSNQSREKKQRIIDFIVGKESFKKPKNKEVLIDLFICRVYCRSGILRPFIDQVKKAEGGGVWLWNTWRDMKLNHINLSKIFYPEWMFLWRRYEGWLQEKWRRYETWGENILSGGYMTRPQSAHVWKLLLKGVF